MKKVSILGIIALSALTLSACSSNKDDSKSTKPKTEHKEDKKSKTKKESKKNDTAKNDNSKTSASTSNNNKVTTDNSNQASNKNSDKQQNNQVDHNLTDDDATKANRYNIDPLAYMYYGTPAQQAERQRIAQHNKEVYDNAMKNKDDSNSDDTNSNNIDAGPSRYDSSGDNVDWAKVDAEKDAAYAQMDKENQDNSQATTNDDSSDN